MTIEAHPSYSAALEHLYPRTNGGIKLGLENTARLLEAVGNPQNSMQHVVVAGTNGKGSTSSLLAHALERAGYRVGLYTSPHLLRFTERVRVNGVEISQKQVVEHYATLCAAEHYCDYPPTFFECVTAMTLLEFQRQEVDIAVMEVGLGGRLDSTNVVPKKLSVITPIALDHQMFLGDTLAEIAAEKAGVIPHEGWVVSAPQKPEAARVLNEVARQRASTLRTATLPGLVSDNARPEFQATNVETARVACEVLGELGFPLSDTHFEEALKTWRWPGRFQELLGQPPVLLDGAHNPHALSALWDTIKKRKKPVHVVFSALATKASGEMLCLLDQKAASIHLCPSSVSRSLSHSELLKLREPGHAVYPSASDALEAAKERALEDAGMVLVTGSLFLVADILHSETGEERDPGIVS
ncbi:MAG: folylpolyglutamate synthase/dihydrofolate synthase family protein [Myxococcota bacterium]|nr:folylpolyglutamate synthase/dihydrofolate synthase family protein [Myxococcota bacterium]